MRNAISLCLPLDRQRRDPRGFRSDETSATRLDGQFALFRTVPASLSMCGARRGTCDDGAVRFSVLVEVRLRPGIADPQGATIERSLPHLGFDGISTVTVGKAIRFTC